MKTREVHTGWRAIAKHRFSLQSSSRPASTRTPAWLACLALLGSLLLAASPGRTAETVTITEFLASNVGGLLDEDGDSSDWIEIYNSGDSAANLAGWFLTDDPSELSKWAFPDTILAPKGFLIVFASGKDRAVSGATLHTSFSLDPDGGYLALVHPDGTNVASAFAPEYPGQRANYSYGIGQLVVTTKLVHSNSAARVLVPSNDSLGLSWINTSFNDTGWISGTNGVGFETSVPGFAVRNFKANIAVGGLGQAEGVITNAAQQTAVYGENSAVINYVNTGAGAHYGSDRTFPGLILNVDVEDFVVEATGTITIPTAGNWTFGVNSDDGFRLTVGSFTVLYDPPRGPSDTLGVFNVPAPGEYPLRLVYYERGGGAEVELFAAPGSFAAWGSNFKLVGDTANGGLAMRSLPVSGGGGLGYGSMIRTDLRSQMLSNNASAFIRLPFRLTNAASLTALTMSVKYDDGFVAYLNGTEVARRNTPASPAWNSSAPASHTGQVAEDINLTERLGLLQEGDNMLAIQGLNESANNFDFFLQTELAEIKGVPTTNQYFTAPTPGTFNGSAGFAGFVADTHFSHDRGFYETNFSCVITTATAGATIRYTINGSRPATTNGTIYTGPIPITNTTVLRAIAYKTGLVSSDIDTETYIFVNDVIRQSPTGQVPGPGWPAPRTSGGQVYDYGMDPDIVNNTNWSGVIRDGLKSLPSFCISMELSDLFDPTRGIYANPSGDEIAWERPGSLELIHADGTEGFQINCGVRIRGGFSRDPNNPKHAFRFFFRQEYGEAKLHYPLFGDNGADTFDKIDLRTMQNYSWAYQNDNRMMCLRDQFSRDGQMAMGQLAERGDFCHLYINGQYWGLYNTDERPEAAYGETYLGGRAEDYDTIKVDPDNGYNVEATDGNTAAWNRLWNAAVAGFTNDVDYFKIQGLNVDGTINTNYENLLEVDNLIVYMLVILYGGNLDAPISNFLANDGPNNFFALRNRTGQYGGFRFMSHDAEHTLLNVNEDRTGIVNGTFGGINPDWTAGDPRNTSSFSKSNPQYVWFRLQGNAEFRLRVADHVQKYCFNGGVLTPEGVRATLLTRSNEIYRAIVCESARWGDAKRAVPFNRNDWVAAMNTVFSSFVNGRTTTLISQLQADNLYPRVSAPRLNQFGGIVSNGFNLFMTNANPGGGSVIYYTLNGPDPRLRGGAVNPTALAYTPGTPLPINFQTLLRARVLSNTVWSALVEASFYTAQDFSKLLISEIMYNPPALGVTPGDELEFLELKNTGTDTFDLSGVLFASGINFAFTNGTRLGPGQFFLLGRNAAALTSKYPGLIVHGLYTGRLDNSGEKVALAHVLGGTILDFDYKDSGRWPVAPDGFGFSLVPKDANTNPSPGNPGNWRASALPGGSPGSDDPTVTIAGILVNEALTHTDLPAVDQIELYNPTAADVNIGGWFLTDDKSVPRKFRIPDNTMIPSHGYIVFSEADFNPPPGTNSTAFALSSTDDEVYLFSTDSNTNLTGYSHGFHFGAAQNSVTFGRYVNSVGDEHFVAQIAPTLGATNAGPRVGPIAFKEIMYHPPDLAGGLDNSADEYLVLQNISGADVPLFDPLASTNTWRLRGGVDLNFPANIILPAAGQAVLVNFDPNNASLLTAFRGKYGLLASLPAYGPYSGKLDNSGQSVELYRPDTPNSNGVPYVLVEEVNYKDSAPWPPAPDGTGSALQRVAPSAYGNDPINWIGAAPLTITVNPRSQSITNGLNYTNSVSAYGTGLLRYQWQFNGGDILDATNATLIILGVGLTNSGAYAVRVSDDLGSALSLSGQLTVLVKPIITLQPQSQTGLEGGNVTFIVGAYGTTPISFRWRRNNVTFTNGLISATATTSSLTVTNLKMGEDAFYNVAITNLAGPATALSSNAFLTVWADFDRDGVADWWEAQFGFDTNSMADADLDPDHDTLSNRQEFIAGTDPHDGQSYLRIDADSFFDIGVYLSFLAVSNKTYTVQASDAVKGGMWLSLTNVDVAPMTRSILVLDVPPPGSTRYYRLVTPKQP